MLIEKRRRNLSKVVTSHESTLQSTDLKSYLLSLFYQVGLDEKKTGAGRKLRKERKNVSTINLRVPPLETSRSLILSLSLPPSPFFTPTASKEGPWNQEEVCWRIQEEVIVWFETHNLSFPFLKLSSSFLLIFVCHCLFHVPILLSLYDLPFILSCFFLFNNIQLTSPLQSHPWQHVKTKALKVGRIKV